MAEQKRRRRSVVEAEVMNQARELAAQKKGNGQRPGNPSVQQVKAQIEEHSQRTNGKYYPELGQELVSYFANPESWEINYNATGTGKVLPKAKMPTFERFAFIKGFSKFTYYNWCETHPEFALAYAEAQELQKAFIIEAASANAMPAQFAMFMLRCNHGMVEPQSGDSDGDSDDVTMTVHGKGQS